MASPRARGRSPFQCSVDVLDESLPWTSVERSRGKEAVAGGGKSGLYFWLSHESA